MKKMQTLFVLSLVLLGTILPSAWVFSDTAFADEAETVTNETNNPESTGTEIQTGDIPVPAAETGNEVAAESVAPQTEAAVVPSENETTENSTSAEQAAPQSEAPIQPVQEVVPELDGLPDSADPSLSVTYAIGTTETKANETSTYYVNLTLGGVAVKGSKLVLTFPKNKFEKINLTNFPLINSAMNIKNGEASETSTDYVITLYLNDMPGGSGVSTPFTAKIRNQSAANNEKVIIKQTLSNEESGIIASKDNEFAIKTTLPVVKVPIDTVVDTIQSENYVEIDGTFYLSPDYPTKWSSTLVGGTDGRDVTIKVELFEDDIFDPELVVNGVKVNQSWNFLEEDGRRYLTKQMKASETDITYYLTHEKMRLNNTTMRPVSSSVVEGEELQVTSQKWIYNQFKKYEKPVEQPEEKPVGRVFTRGSLSVDEKTNKYTTLVQLQHYSANPSKDEEKNPVYLMKKLEYQFYDYEVTNNTTQKRLPRTIESVTISARDESVDVEAMKKNGLYGITVGGETKLIKENIAINQSVALTGGEQEPYQAIYLEFSDSVKMKLSNYNSQMVFSFISTPVEETLNNIETFRQSAENINYYYQVYHHFSFYSEKGYDDYNKYPFYNYKLNYFSVENSSLAIQDLAGYSKSESFSNESFVISDTKKFGGTIASRVLDKATYVVTFPKDLDFVKLESRDVSVSNTRVVYNYKGTGLNAIIAKVSKSEVYRGNEFNLKTYFRTKKNSAEGYANIDTYFIPNEEAGDSSNRIRVVGGEADKLDINENGNVDEICLHSAANLKVTPNREAHFSSESKDGDEEGFGSGTNVEGGSIVDLEITIDNKGNGELQQLEVLDILPYKGDFTFKKNNNNDSKLSRGSDFSGSLVGPIEEDPDYIIYYSKAEPSTSFAENMTSETWQLAGDVGDFSQVRMIKIVMKSDAQIAKGERKSFKFQMSIPDAHEIDKDDAKLVNTIAGATGKEYGALFESEFNTISLTRYDMDGYVYLSREDGVTSYLGLEGYAVKLYKVEDEGEPEILAETTTNYSGYYSFKKLGNYQENGKFFQNSGKYYVKLEAKNSEDNIIESPVVNTDGVSNEFSLSVNNNKKSINFNVRTGKKRVNVRYVDEDDNDLLSVVTIEGYVGETYYAPLKVYDNYRDEPKELKYYTPDFERYPENAYGKYQYVENETEVPTVTFVYKKIGKVKVIHAMLRDNEETLLESYFADADSEGKCVVQRMTTDCRILKYMKVDGVLRMENSLLLGLGSDEYGYRFWQPGGDYPWNYTIKCEVGKTTEVKFIYIPQGGVLLKFYDENRNAIKQDIYYAIQDYVVGLEGAPLAKDVSVAVSKREEEQDGYKFEQFYSTAGETYSVYAYPPEEIHYQLKPAGTVKVEYCDADGNPLAGEASDIYKGYDDESYNDQVKPRVIPGYEVESYKVFYDDKEITSPAEDADAPKAVEDGKVSEPLTGKFKTMTKGDGPGKIGKTYTVKYYYKQRKLTTITVKHRHGVVVSDNPKPKVNSVGSIIGEKEDTKILPNTAEKNLVKALVIEVIEDDKVVVKWTLTKKQDGTRCLTNEGNPAIDDPAEVSKKLLDFGISEVTEDWEVKGEYVDAKLTLTFDYAKTEVEVQHLIGDQPIQDRNTLEGYFGSDFGSASKEVKPIAGKEKLVDSMTVRVEGEEPITIKSPADFKDEFKDKLTALGITAISDNWEITGTHQAKNLMVSFNYAEGNTITVQHSYQDKVEINGKKTQTGKKDSAFAAIAPNEDGTVNSIKFTVGIGKEWTLTKTDKGFVLKDEAGQEIGDALTSLGAYGITGISDKWEITGKHVSKDVTITYMYGSNVTPKPDPTPTPDPKPTPDYKLVYVKYVDEKGKEIATSSVLTGEVGAKYQASGKIIAGYDLIGLAANSDAESGVFGNSVKTVVYTYKKKAGTPEIPTDPNNPTNPETPTDPVNPTNPETPTNPGDVTPTPVTPTPTPENNGSDKADGDGEKNESGAGNAKVTGNVKNATTKNKNDLPKTGEANNTALWFIGVVCIVLAFVFFQKYRGKNNAK